MRGIFTLDFDLDCDRIEPINKQQFLSTNRNTREHIHRLIVSIFTNKLN